MAQTWRVEVLNDGALNLLRDMELMRLIKLSSDRPAQKRSGKDLIAKYKGVAGGTAAGRDRPAVEVTPRLH